MCQEDAGLQIAGWEISSDFAVSWLASQLSPLPGTVTMSKQSCSGGSKPSIRPASSLLLSGCHSAFILETERYFAAWLCTGVWYLTLVEATHPDLQAYFTFFGVLQGQVWGSAIYYLWCPQPPTAGVHLQPPSDGLVQFHSRCSSSSLVIPVCCSFPSAFQFGVLLTAVSSHRLMISTVSG